MKDDSAKEDFEEADDLGDIDSIDDSLDNEAHKKQKSWVGTSALLKLG